LILALSISLPINAGTLNGDVRATFTGKPVGEAQEIVRHCRESVCLPLALFDETDNSSFGVNVNTTATRIKNLHLTLLQPTNKPPA
jgi:hypothetical protein